MLIFVPVLIAAEVLAAAIAAVGIGAIPAVWDASSEVEDWLFAIFAFETTGGLLLSEVAVFAGSFAVVFLFRRLLDRRSIGSLGFSTRRYGLHFLLGCLTGAAAIALGFFVLHVSGFVVAASPVRCPDVRFLITGFALFVVVAVGEEMIMRGYILSNLATSMSWIAAILVSSVLFSAAHVLNNNLSIIGLVNIGLSGVAFGVYYYYFRNLWFPIGLHLCWNFFQGPVFGFAVSGLRTESLMTLSLKGPDWLTGGAFGLEGSVVASLLEVIAIWGIHLAATKQRALQDR